MQQLYDGPQAEALPDLAAYTGEAAADRIVGESRRAGYLLNYRQLGINYGENVEFQLRRERRTPRTAPPASTPGGRRHVLPETHSRVCRWLQNG